LTGLPTTIRTWLAHICASNTANHSFCLSGPVICLLILFVLDAPIVRYRGTGRRETEGGIEPTQTRSASEAVVEIEAKEGIVIVRATGIETAMPETGIGTENVDEKEMARDTEAAGMMAPIVDTVTVTETAIETGMTRTATEGVRGMSMRAPNATTTIGSKEKEVRFLTTYHHPHHPRHLLQFYPLHSPETVLIQFVPLIAKKVTGLIHETNLMNPEAAADVRPAGI
jgi:hypothetical protein